MGADIIEPGELSYLTYLSTAVQRFTQTDLKHLLNGSRQRNAAKGVTGLLLYRDGHFFQYLEGSEPSVVSTYSRIRLDNRHKAARMIGSGRLKARMFPEWQMGYKNMAGVRSFNTAGYSECLQPNYVTTGNGDPAERFARIFEGLMAQDVKSTKV